jgi:Chaperone of endosialidase
MVTSRLKSIALALSLLFCVSSISAQVYPYYPPPGQSWNSSTGQLTLSGTFSGINGQTIPGTAIISGGFNFPGPNIQTGSTYTAALTDKSALVLMAYVGTSTVTIPTHASVAFAIGNYFVIENGGLNGATNVTVEGASGVTVNCDPSCTTSGRGATLVAIQSATNIWNVLPYFTNNTSMVIGNGICAGCYGPSGTNNFGYVTGGTGAGSTTGLGMEDGEFFTLNSVGNFSSLANVVPDGTNNAITVSWDNIESLESFYQSESAIAQNWDTVSSSTYTISTFSNGSITFTGTPTTSGTLTANFSGPTGTQDIYWAQGGLSQGNFTHGSESVTSISVSTQGPETASATWNNLDDGVPNFDAYTGYFLNAASNSVTVTLPAAAYLPTTDSAGALREQFCRSDNSANTVTIEAAGSDTIVGGVTSTTVTLSPYDCAILQSDGVSSWHVMNVFPPEGLTYDGSGGLGVRQLTASPTGTTAGVIVDGASGEYASIALKDGNTGNDVWDLFSGNPSAGTFLIYNTTTSKAGMEIPGTGVPEFPNVPSATGATSGYVCFTSSTGALSYDGTNTCLVSSEAYKKDVRALNPGSGLKEIEALRPISFEYLPQYNPGSLGPQVGFLAEDVAKIDPRLTAFDPKTHAPRSVQYDHVTVILTLAVQQLHREIEALIASCAALFFWCAYLTLKVTMLYKVKGVRPQ